MPGTDFFVFPGSTHTWISVIRIEAKTDAARCFGIFGSPSFVAGEELSWGDDRLGAALH